MLSTLVLEVPALVERCITVEAKAPTATSILATQHQLAETSSLSLAQRKGKDETMSELDDLKKEVKELKDQLNPPPRPPSNHPRFDPTEGMTMPANALAAMVAAVPEGLMGDLRADARKPNPVTGGASPQPQQVKRGSGWIDAKPLTPPPGISLVDEIAEGFEKRERRGQ